MPPVIIGSLVAAAAYSVTALATGLIAASAFLSTFVTVFAVSAAVGLVTQALAPSSAVGDFANAPRTVNVTDPVTTRRIVVGEVRIGGPRVYFTTTDSNKLLHLVVVHAGHEVDSFAEKLIDGETVMTDSNGEVLGRFAGFADEDEYADEGLVSHARLKTHTGAPGQTADADLVAEVAEWTSAHKGTGIAYSYGRFRYNLDLYDAVPHISAVVRGLKVYDPRDGGTRWTRNPALIKRWYLTDTTYGLGVDPADIDDASVTEAANICDEMVPVVSAPSDVFHARVPIDCHVERKALQICQQKLAAGEVSDCSVEEAALTACETPALWDLLWRPTRTVRLRIGDRVQVSSTGILPPPLSAATNYYAIVERRSALRDRSSASWSFQAHLSDAIDDGWDPDVDDDQSEISTFRLAATYADALAGNAIAITGLGSGTHSLTRHSEPRYTCDGVIDTGLMPERILQALNSSDAGSVIKQGGKWHIHAGAWRTPEATGLNEDDLRGPIRVTTLVSRSELCNGVKGVFIDPDQNWQPVDFPPVASDTYKTLDGGQRLWRDMELAFTTSPSMAQRLAKIELLRSRQQMAIEMPCKLTAFDLAPGKIVPVTNALFDWSAKNFEVLEWRLAVEEKDATPMLGVDLVLRETDTSVFDWSTSEESTIDPAPNTGLANPFIIPRPGVSEVSEELYVGRDGAGVKVRALVSWMAPGDAFVDAYVLQYRPAGATEWIPQPPVALTEDSVNDLAPGSYEFRIQARNDRGGFSDWSPVATHEILGLLAPPADPSGLTIQTISALAILTWDRHPDLDVRIGGRIRVRWSPALSGATWASAIEVTDPVPGDATQAVAPLREGSYLIRAYDSSRLPSAAAATISTRAAEHLSFTTLSTVTESPSFPGTHNNTVASDGALKLSGSGLFDDIPDLDALADLDSYGGITTSGIYDFAGGIDLGSVKTVRLTTSVTALAKNTLDRIDDRTADIDDWEDFDGTVAAEADLQVWARETDDDPAGSPSWSTWRRLTAGDRNARAFQFQARLTSANSAYNIECTALSVTAEEIA